MLIKYQGGKLYPELSMWVPLILEGIILTFSLTYPLWHSRTENNLKICIANFLDFNIKLSSLEKVYILQYFSMSKRNNIKSFLVSTVIYLIKFLDKNWKMDVYTGGGYSWTLWLSRNYWIPKYTDHFRLALSLFWCLIFHKTLYSNSLDSYCSSPHWTEYYLRMLWKNLTEGWFLNYTWT